MQTKSEGVFDLNILKLKYMHLIVVDKNNMKNPE